MKLVYQIFIVLLTMATAAMWSWALIFICDVYTVSMSSIKQNIQISPLSLILAIICTTGLFFIVKREKDRIVDIFIPFLGIVLGLLVIIVCFLITYVIGFIFVVGLSIIILFFLWALTGGFKRYLKTPI